MNCWEFKKCATTVREGCPAHPDQGLICWKVTGTKCAGGVMEKASIAEKVQYCRSCDFYQQYAQKF